MQGFVEWWCLLIGVTDRTAVSIATGAIAASILWIIGLVVVKIASAILGRIVHLQ